MRREREKKIWLRFVLKFQLYFWSTWISGKMYSFNIQKKKKNMVFIWKTMFNHCCCCCCLCVSHWLFAYMCSSVLKKKNIKSIRPKWHMSDIFYYYTEISTNIRWIELFEFFSSKKKILKSPSRGNDFTQRVIYWFNNIGHFIMTPHI